MIWRCGVWPVWRQRSCRDRSFAQSHRSRHAPLPTTSKFYLSTSSSTSVGQLLVVVGHSLLLPAHKTCPFTTNRRTVTSTGRPARYGRHPADWTHPSPRHHCVSTSRPFYLPPHRLLPTVDDVRGGTVPPMTSFQGVNRVSMEAAACRLARTAIFGERAADADSGLVTWISDWRQPLQQPQQEQQLQ